MAAAQVDSSVDDAVEARLLCSFAPALMLSAMEREGTAIQPPTTHHYQGIALFAVCRAGQSAWSLSELTCLLVFPLTLSRIFLASRL